MFERCGRSWAEVDVERIMQRAGQKSDKPIDLFKIKSKDKGQAGARGSTGGLRSTRGHAATRRLVFHALRGGSLA